ncbi:hypothetical protein [uncultured Paraglaciecola sp.]|uniref:hypothetical protein n=1 Tax=uncultured Paraglaciecola sp. TaxID=1765024 RepID=UPI00260A2C0A|nr:hypothetical protein [uncultured Paraglaciecola sp.]
MDTYNDNPARVDPPESPIELTKLRRKNQDRNDADQNWRNQDVLSESVGDGLAYKISTNDIFHQQLVKAKEAGDVALFGQLCFKAIDEQIMEWV